MTLPKQALNFNASAHGLSAILSGSPNLSPGLPSSCFCLVYESIVGKIGDRFSLKALHLK